jgi:hypothetical protein
VTDDGRVYSLDCCFDTRSRVDAAANGRLPVKI